MESSHKEHVVVGSRLSQIWQVVGFGTMLAISCLVSYWVITTILAREYFASRDNDLLGGMWAVVATIFVFRHSVHKSTRAALSRTLATFFSFALSFFYLLFFPFSVYGMVTLIWISTVILILIGRSEDVVTAGTTIAAVFVIASLSPGPSWMQPILRLADTTVGTTVGMLASLLRPALGLTPAPQLASD